MAKAFFLGGLFLFVAAPTLRESSPQTILWAAPAILIAAMIIAWAAESGISTEFIQSVEKMMRPGTSALFLLNEEGDLDVIQHAIHGLGGTVLKTNVDLERAKLIQSSLAG